MSEVEHELLAAIAAAPADVTARQVYADWLIARGDERGELISLELAERDGRELSNLEPLLRLSAIHGFPRWPEDPDDELLPFTIERNYGPRYVVRHRDIEYRIMYQRGVLTIETDSLPHSFPALGLRQLNRWDDHHADVFLSIISRTLRLEHELTLIEWPRRGAIEDLERFTRKRRPYYHLGLGLMAPGRPARPEPQFGVIDYERWGLLWERWDRARRR